MATTQHPPPAAVPTTNQEDDVASSREASSPEESLLLYESAVQALYGPEHQSTTRQALQKAAARRTRTVADMRHYMVAVGLSSPSPCTGNTKVVHISGTKGKGSTAAFCEGLCRHAYQLHTGLFTSPHLVSIRERIRIDGQPISRRDFGKVYWELRRRLEAHSAKIRKQQNQQQADTDDDTHPPVLPGYFRMLTLMALFAFHHYASPPLDVVILEVGMGGRYDATNVFDNMTTSATATTNTTTTSPPTTVCGVTLLDYDHVRVLGPTLRDIAWEKGGIYQVVKGLRRTTSPRPTPRPEDDAYLVEEEEGVTTTKNTEEETHIPQQQRTFFALDSSPAEALDVLRQCARVEGQGGRLVTVGSSSSSPSESKSHGIRTRLLPDDVVLPGMPGEHQRDNATLALALCQHLLERPSADNDDDDGHGATRNKKQRLHRALSLVSWPGRCQTVTRQMSSNGATIHWRLDGAHTLQSLRAGCQWAFNATASENDVATIPARRRVLVFNCSHERDPAQLLPLLAADENGSPRLYQAVYFCNPDAERPSAVSKPSARAMLVAAGFAKEQHESADVPPLPLDNNNNDDDDDDDGRSSSSSSWQETLATLWRYFRQKQIMAYPEKDDARRALLDSEIIETNLSATALRQHLEATLAEEEEGNGDGVTTEVFVTGSLLLVGSVLDALNWKEPEALPGVEIPPLP